MKQLIVLVATIILGITIGGTVVDMGSSVEGVATAVDTTIQDTLIKDGKLNSSFK